MKSLKQIQEEELKKFDEEVAEQAFQEYQADLSKEKAVEEYRQQLLKAVEEMKENLPLGDSLNEREMGFLSGKHDAYFEVIDLLKAKDNMEGDL